MEIQASTGAAVSSGKIESELTLVIDKIHILALQLKFSVSCWRLSSVPKDQLQFLATRMPPTWPLASWTLASSKLASERERETASKMESYIM